MSVRQMKLAFLIAMCFALVFSSCQRAPELSADTLTGIWVHGRDSLVFNQDGTFQYVRDLEELDAMRFDAGTYIFEGTTLTLTSATGVLGCAGDTGVYELELTREGVLKLALVEDECITRRSTFEISPYTKKTP